MWGCAISDTWVGTPRKLPFKCRRSGRSSEMEGPYFEDSLPYCEAPGDDRELTHYISPGWLKRIADLPGSPIVVLDREEYEAMTAALDAARSERDELRRRLEEAEAPQVVVSPVDVDALAGALIVPLSDHFAKKPGPKPRAA